MRKTTIQGKHSVLENLPQVIGEVIHNHAYFSIVGITEIFLGLEFEWMYLPPFSEFRSWYNNEVGNNVNQNDIRLAEDLEKSYY